MDSFKILRDSRGTSSAHLRAKCGKKGQEFLIRLEYEKAAWWMVYASEQAIPALSQVSDGGTEITFENGLYVGDNYACPYCGNRSIVSCGACGRITCTDSSKYFICGYCGNSGEIKGVIASAHVEKQQQNGKK